MLLIPGPFALGRHVYFFRAGDAITIPAAGTGSIAGPAASNNKPDPTDPLYNDLGDIAEWTSDNKGTGDEKIYAPSPGRMQLVKIVEKGSDQMEKFTSQTLSPLALEVFYKTSQKLTTAGGVFNPNSAPPREGWIHTELYDQGNNFVMNYDLYGMLRITGGMASKEGGVLKPQYEFNVYYTPLNVGLLSNA